MKSMKQSKTNSFFNNEETLVIAKEKFLWAKSLVNDDVPERIYNFTTTGGEPLTLASNFPYEVWVDGKFIGDGGHRCANGEALADYWYETKNATEVLVRLHWMNPAATRVYFRCLFEDPFFVGLPSEKEWKCSIENKIHFGAKVCEQLPRQTIVTKAHNTDISLVPAKLFTDWKILLSPISRSNFIPIELKLIQSTIIKVLKQKAFKPSTAANIALYVREEQPCDLICETFDLGQIALYRFEIKTENSECVLTYSEVSSFDEAVATSSRAKVQMADAFVEEIQTGVFGFRGCRYVHVLYEVNTTKPILKGWRREYPLEWKTVIADTVDYPIIEACRNNLIACVDGGVVDTCWRERSQWTGDLRMSSKALRSLTNNLEVIDLALHQIAKSYDPKNGMISGAWPIWTPGEYLPIPTFHLSFCLTAIEHDPELKRDPLVKSVVNNSIEFWTKHYLQDGLIQGMRGWYFTDWDPTDAMVAASRMPIDDISPHAVCNAWWSELCDTMAPNLAIQASVFDAAFWTGEAYSLTFKESKNSPHASATAITCSSGKDKRLEALSYLEAEISNGNLRKRVTPYFAYFIANALRYVSIERSMKFIREYYGPIARDFGTIYEKTEANASLAHSWSIGIVPWLLQK